MKFPHPPLSETQIKIAVPQIRSLVLNDPAAKKALGGQHYVFSEELFRELYQFGIFLRDEVLKRPRVRLGYCAFDDHGKVAGYHAITIMQTAKPNKEEKKYIGLMAPLEYVQAKKLVVRKDCRRIGIASNLLQFSIDIADRLKKEWCGDVLANNIKVIKLLEKLGVKKLFEWRNRAGNFMYRMGRA